MLHIIITHSYVHVWRTSRKYTTLVLVCSIHLLRLISLEVWRRMGSVIMITNALMIPMHEVVTRKVVVLEKTNKHVQGCCRRDGIDAIAG